MADKTDELGWSDLHHAVADRLTNLVHSLLEQREETVNMPDGQGRTPLHLACSNIEDKETESIIELLLIHGADPQILDKTGKSSFHCLIDHWLTKKSPLGEIRKKIITQFLQCGTDINCKDINGRTPLHYVAGSPDMKVPEVYTKMTELERLIWGIPPPASVKEPNLAKPTSESQACMKEFLAYLLSSGANVNAADHEGNTPLHLAIAANKFVIVKELLLRRLNINVKNNVGQTPLHHAVSDKGKFDHCAILLLHKGALANIADRAGHTPVDIVRDWVGRTPVDIGGTRGWVYYRFLKHLILLIDVKMHPEMDIHAGKDYKSVIKRLKGQCKKLNNYLKFGGKSQLPVILQSHSFPVYTENAFFETKLKGIGFNLRFFDYSYFLTYKFAKDVKRRRMIENCTRIFVDFTITGQLVYNRYSHWGFLPEKLKLQILSYLNNDELESLNTIVSQQQEA